MRKSEKNERILTELERLYPEAKPALRFASPYELLVAVILSAQCTDERVNKVTAELFKQYNTPEKMLTLTQEKLEKKIYSCGFYHVKAEHILSASKDIIEKFDGNVPDNLDDLRTLAGVGRKTANVVYAVAFGGDAIAVDTHVFRVSNRLALAHASTPETTETQLMKAVPKEKWSKAHHWLIYHGRRVCRSQNPDCMSCTLQELCEFYKNGRKNKNTSDGKNGRKNK